jgi:hypothetical protein
LRTITTTSPLGPRFFPVLAYTTPYLLKSTGRDSSVDVKSATSGGGAAAVTSESEFETAIVGSSWNSKPLIVSFAVMCTNFASGSISHAEGSGYRASPSGDVAATCSHAQYLDASPAARLLQNPSPTNCALFFVVAPGVSGPARFSGIAANIAWPPPCMSKTS